MKIGYYDIHAKSYFDSTVALKVDEVMQRFLTYAPAAGHFLDAGCGSGRDTVAFLEKGYQVTAFDASASLAKLATQHCGQEVLNMTFDDVQWTNAFEGVWACASLVHLKSEELSRALSNLTRALKHDGAFFFCMKAGTSGYVDGTGRFFNRHTPDTLAPFLQELGLSVKDYWASDSKREPNVQWNNFVCKLT